MGGLGHCLINCPLGLEDPEQSFSLVFTVDATPDIRELERNEIKTQVELATGQQGLRRASREHSFPQMLHRVGLPLLTSLAATEKQEIPQQTSSARAELVDQCALGF